MRRSSVARVIVPPLPLQVLHPLPQVAEVFQVYRVFEVSQQHRKAMRQRLNKVRLGQQTNSLDF